MPDDIHEILVNLKKEFRLSVNSTIMKYIAKGLIADKFYPIDKIMFLSKRYQKIELKDTKEVAK